MQNKREENFINKGMTNGILGRETMKIDLRGNPKKSESSVVRSVKCTKQSDVGDAMLRPQSLISDKDLRKREAIVEHIPHEFCPRSLNPKQSEKDYLYWLDKANRKHMKFQAEFLKRLDCDRHRSTSQFNQDIRIHRQFFKFKKGLIFVEVGALSK